ncbi:MAG TPA: DUF1794 domain-containing protein [Gammaproteobacteria bacterium]|nr:DUF1794 domain-containing protein [Gammaproteobacteria bacterium]
MNTIENNTYGPLQGLIGTWKGDKGLDIAPEPDGTENNPYYEVITYSAIGDVTNAESQVLVALHYRQIVRRKSNHEIFHDQTGYWMWDARAALIMHSLTIPRAVCLLAGGSYDGEGQKTDCLKIEVSASMSDSDWSIIQSPFLQNNALTTKFHQQIILGDNSLAYSQTTSLEIYGKTFEHTDENQLSRQ